MGPLDISASPLLQVQPLVGAMMMPGNYAAGGYHPTSVRAPQYAYADPYNARADSFHSDHEACCFLPNPCSGAEQNRIAEQQWTYVGEGRGTHHCAPEYVYVGQGAGAWLREEKYFASPKSYRCLWILAGLACFLLTMAIVLGLSALLGQEGVGDWLRGAGHHVHGHLSRAGQHIHGAASAAHGHIKEHGPGYLDHLKNGAHAVGHHAGNAARAVHGAVKEHGPGVWEHVKNASHKVHNAVKEHGPGVLEHVKGAGSQVGDAVKEHGPGVWEGVKNGASSVHNTIREGASTVVANQTATL